MKNILRVESALLLLLLLCYQRVTYVAGGVILRDVEETPTEIELSTAVDSKQLLEEGDPKLIIKNFLLNFPKQGQSVEGFEVEKGGIAEERVAMNSVLTDQGTLSATYVNSGAESILESEPQPSKQQRTGRITESKTSRRVIANIKKHALKTNFSSSRKEHSDVDKGVYSIKYPHHSMSGRMSADEVILDTIVYPDQTTVEVVTTTTPLSTTISPFEAFCMEACGQGVGGPECYCPNHPIG